MSQFCPACYMAKRYCRSCRRTVCSCSWSACKHRLALEAKIEAQAQVKARRAGDHGRWNRLGADYALTYELDGSVVLWRFKPNSGDVAWRFRVEAKDRPNYRKRAPSKRH